MIGQDEFMNGFLPTTKKEMEELGWDAPDFVYVTGDAYVDHPSFGHAIISRVLESHGYKVGIMAAMVSILQNGLRRRFSTRSIRTSSISS